MDMIDTKKAVKKIPYGISDYGDIRSGNYYYVDKTGYLPKIENAGSFLFFIRPRRFGKSLFLAVLQAYYDIHYKDRFEELFKGTWIFEHPTPEQGKYLVLFLNFSQIDPPVDKLENSFLEHIRRRALSFLRKYADKLITDLDFTKKKIEESLSAADILSSISDICRDSQQDVYVIIDEYDNFANTLLSSSGAEAYRKLTRDEGFLRAFFNILKGGTTSIDSPIKRMFITGVSPITMDDVTSGFNIGEQISLEPAFNQMLGFTRQDVEAMLNYYTAAGLIPSEHGMLLDIIDYWYGNYLFSEDDTVTMYNSDMVLYFLKHYLNRQKIPRDFIDRNVRMDYGKLRHLIVVDKDNSQKPTTNGNFSKLKKIIEYGSISSRLVKGFPLDEVTAPLHFNSLLFYLGLLTIGGIDRDQLHLVIPNETVKRLFYDYIEKGYRETGVFSLNLGKYEDLMTNMAYDGHWQPLFEFITGLMSQSMSLRDLISGEKSVQAFLNVYLGLSELFIIHSEKELNKGYADLYMEPYIARYEQVAYGYLLELKYVAAGMTPEDPRVAQLRSDAEAQLRQYTLDKKFQKTLEKTTLIKLVLIFSGHKLLYLGKVE